MATRPEPRLTYEDYLHFPDDKRYEIIDGEAFVTPSPTVRHQELVGRLYRVIAGHVEDHGGGAVFVAPLDVVLTESDVVQPDIVFVGEADTDVLTEANVRGTPTWLVEVLSDPRRDRNLKRQAYARTGVGEYWIVDGEQELVEVYRLSAGSYPDPAVWRPPAVVHAEALPDCGIDLAYLFRG